MQVMPATSEEMGVSGRALYEPEANIRAGSPTATRPRGSCSASWRRTTPDVRKVLLFYRSRVTDLVAKI